MHLTDVLPERIAYRHTCTCGRLWSREDLVQRAAPRKVTVCSACKCASCWQGIYMCEAAANAGTVELSFSELEALDREHPRFWSGEEQAC